MSLLKVSNLRKKYKARTVVHDVSFNVGSGEVVGLLGPNGAGKTTCFYMIVGLVAADGGEITLDDEVLTHRPIHQRARLGLSYLPQEMSVFRKLTVAENIQAVLELQNLSKAQIASRLSPYGRRKRPRLRGLDDAGLVAFMEGDMAVREPFYAQAHLVVDCDAMSDDQVVEHILRQLGLK